MDALFRLARNAIALDENQIGFEAFSEPVVKLKIIELNTLSQLYDKGEDSKGRSLSDIGGSYSDFTVQEKLNDRNAPVGRSFFFDRDRVQLFDTGDFYDSFFVEPSIGFIEIFADPIKDDGTNLFSEWGADIVGLQNQSIDELNKTLLPVFQDKTFAALTKGV